MKILNFGSCNIDYVYSVDHIVAVGETETSHKLETFPGGKGLNQSIAVAKAGGEIYHAGCVGEGGEMLTEIMKKSGVNLSYLAKTEEKNGHAIIQLSDKGENSIFLYPGSNEMVTREYVDEVLENFEKGDIILLQNEISNVDYIVEKAYDKGMCIILNPSPFNEKLKKIDFGKLSYIILNEVEANMVSGKSDSEESLAYIKKKYPDLKIMLTLGGRGCVYADSACEVPQCAFCVEVVDTTAAGDTFTGYFVAEIAKGTEYKKVLKIASAASAIAVSRKGAAPSIPSAGEVMAVLETLKERKADNKAKLITSKIEEYLEKNLKTASLEELSKILGYSAVYTGTLVKKLTGQSFSKLIQAKRCTAAAKMLLETDLSVKAITEEAGYENEGFFRRIFKEKYGRNPLEYRKRGAR